MYSHEDRLRAVQLYIKLGKRVGLTIRQLGYPTKNALKSWYREYEQGVELPAGYTRQAKYTPEQQERAVNHLAVNHFLENGRCISVTRRALGYPRRQLLTAWVQAWRPEMRPRLVGRARELSPKDKQSAVIALCTRQASAQSVAEEIGARRETLYNWKHQLLGSDASLRLHDAQT